MLELSSCNAYSRHKMALMRLNSADTVKGINSKDSPTKNVRKKVDVMVTYLRLGQGARCFGVFVCLFFFCMFWWSMLRTGRAGWWGHPSPKRRSLGHSVFCHSWNVLIASTYLNTKTVAVRGPSCTGRGWGRMLPRRRCPRRVPTSTVPWLAVHAEHRPLEGWALYCSPLPGAGDRIPGSNSCLTQSLQDFSLNTTAMF